MKTAGIDFIYFAGLFTSGGLALFIYFGNHALEFLRRFGPASIGTEKQKFVPGNPLPRSFRRKTVRQPTITCSLPLHQEARPEAPFFLK
jgi:hypothetical protein